VALVNRPLHFRLALAGAIVAALTLSGCGRKGALEAPAGAAVTVDPAADTTDTGAKKPIRPFVLDKLL